MKFLVLAIISLTSYLSANNNYDVYFKATANLFDLDVNKLKRFAVIETGMSPYSANLQLKTKRIKKYLDQYKISNIYKYDKEKKIYIFSLNINDSDKADIFYYILKNYKFYFKDELITYDLGIMQINNRNLERKKRDEYKYYKDVKYNIFFGGLVYRDCLNIFKDEKNAIECYNKGTNQKNFDYNYYKKYNS